MHLAGPERHVPQLRTDLHVPFAFAGQEPALHYRHSPGGIASVSATNKIAVLHFICPPHCVHLPYVLTVQQLAGRRQRQPRSLNLLHQSLHGCLVIILNDVFAQDRLFGFLSSNAGENPEADQRGVADLQRDCYRQGNVINQNTGNHDGHACQYHSPAGLLTRSGH